MAIVTIAEASPANSDHSPTCRGERLYAHKCGITVSRIPAIAAQGAVMQPKRPDARIVSNGSSAAMDAHLKRQERDAMAMATNPRFKNVPIGGKSRAVMGHQAPLSGAPHTLPPRPLQTTASCRQAVQNPTP